MRAVNGPCGLPLAAAGLLIALAACSDSSPATTPTPPTTTTTTTTQPPGQLLISGTELVPARQVFLRDLTTTATGRLDVTIDYTPAGNSLPMWLTDRQCSFVLFDRDQCDYLVKSVEGTGQKTMSASNVPAGTYTLFVANDGPADANLTYRVTLTAPATASARLTAGPGRVQPRR